MATTLLRLGRFGSVKCLQLERLGVLRNCPAALCTQAEKPTKPEKKAKPASKTAASPDERASLLAYKTAVAFPVRLSEPGIFQTKATDESEATSTATAKTVSSAPVTEPVTATSEPVVPEPEPAEASTSDPAVLPDDAEGITDKVLPLVDAAPESLHNEADEVSAPVAGATVGNATTSVAAHLEPEDPGALEESSSSSSSSSSSASDSDSDSDSDDEKSEVKSQTGALPEEVSESITQKGRTNVQEVPHGVREKGHEAEMENAPGPEGASEPGQDDSTAAVSSQPLQSVETLSSSSEEFVDCAPEISTVDQGTPELSKTTAEGALQPTPGATADVVRPAVPDAQVESPAVPVPEVSEAATVSESQTESEVPTDIPGESGEPAPAEDPRELAPAEDPREAVSAAVEPLVEAEATEVTTGQTAPGTGAGVSTPGGSTEELLDPAPVIAEGEGEELQVETPAEPPEEAAATPPGPEEPFDNSTYKNKQHHSYTPFTFVDMDVEMSKHRLPQPSTGRPSPQH